LNAYVNEFEENNIMERAAELDRNPKGSKKERKKERRKEK
jgi:hypothetical protein